ncbi:MAG: hypothetical protein RLZZ555_1476 [Pseudomonadota bacterium]|jgi:hypothetical protein
MKLIYEPRDVPPIPVTVFALRLLAHASVATGLIAISLVVGMLGYRYFEQMSWVDAFLNAAMLLGGMGPVKTSDMSTEGKVFAGCYALYSGLAFIAIMGIMLAPVVHRILHRFHWSEQAEP